MEEVKIGTIKLFKRSTLSGVISSQMSESSSRPRDLYFEVDKSEAAGLRVGQLVQFVVKADDDERARDVEVLSQRS